MSGKKTQTCPPPLLRSSIVDEDERTQVFMRLWTLKEAYVKALGTGISAPPGLKGFALDWATRAEQPYRAELARLGGLPPHPSPWQLAFRILDDPPPPTEGGVDAVGPPPGSTQANSPEPGPQPVDSGSRPGSQHADSGSRSGSQPSDPGSGPEARHFKFLLCEPSPEHVATLCLDSPPAWLEPGALDGSGGGSGDGGSGGGGLVVRHWECVPLVSQEALQGARTLGCTL